MDGFGYDNWGRRNSSTRFAPDSMDDSLYNSGFSENSQDYAPLTGRRTSTSHTPKDNYDFEISEDYYDQSPDVKKNTNANKFGGSLRRGSINDRAKEILENNRKKSTTQESEDTKAFKSLKDEFDELLGDIPAATIEEVSKNQKTANTRKVEPNDSFQDDYSDLSPDYKVKNDKRASMSSNTNNKFSGRHGKYEESADSIDISAADLEVGAFAARRAKEKQADRGRRLSFDQATGSTLPMKEPFSPDVHNKNKPNSLNDSNKRRMTTNSVNPNNVQLSAALSSIHRSRNNSFEELDIITNSINNAATNTRSKSMNAAQLTRNPSAADVSMKNKDGFVQYGSIEKSDDDLYKMLNTMDKTASQHRSNIVDNSEHGEYTEDEEELFDEDRDENNTRNSDRESLETPSFYAQDSKTTVNKLERQIANSENILKPANSVDDYEDDYEDDHHHENVSMESEQKRQRGAGKTNESYEDDYAEDFEEDANQSQIRALPTNGPSDGNVDHKVASVTAANAEQKVDNNAVAGLTSIEQYMQRWQLSLDTFKQGNTLSAAPTTNTNTLSANAPTIKTTEYNGSEDQDAETPKPFTNNSTVFNNPYQNVSNNNANVISGQPSLAQKVFESVDEANEEKKSDNAKLNTLEIPTWSDEDILKRAQRDENDGPQKGQEQQQQAHGREEYPITKSFDDENDDNDLYSAQNQRAMSIPQRKRSVSFEPVTSDLDLTNQQIQRKESSDEDEQRELRGDRPSMQRKASRTSLSGRSSRYSQQSDSDAQESEEPVRDEESESEHSYEYKKKPLNKKRKSSSARRTSRSSADRDALDLIGAARDAEDDDHEDINVYRSRSKSIASKKPEKSRSRSNSVNKSKETQQSAAGQSKVKLAASTAAKLQKKKTHKGLQSSQQIHPSHYQPPVLLIQPSNAESTRQHLLKRELNTLHSEVQELRSSFTQFMRQNQQLDVNQNSQQQQMLQSLTQSISSLQQSLRRSQPRSQSRSLFSRSIESPQQLPAAEAERDIFNKNYTFHKHPLKTTSQQPQQRSASRSRSNTPNRPPTTQQTASQSHSHSQVGGHHSVIAAVERPMIQTVDRMMSQIEQLFALHGIEKSRGEVNAALDFQIDHAKIAHFKEQANDAEEQLKLLITRLIEQLAELKEKEREIHAREKLLAIKETIHAAEKSHTRDEKTEENAEVLGELQQRLQTTLASNERLVEENRLLSQKLRVSEEELRALKAQHVDQQQVIENLQQQLLLSSAGQGDGQSEQHPTSNQGSAGAERDDLFVVHRRVEIIAPVEELLQQHKAAAAKAQAQYQRQVNASSHASENLISIKPALLESLLRDYLTQEKIIAQLQAETARNSQAIRAFQSNATAFKAMVFDEKQAFHRERLSLQQQQGGVESSAGKVLAGESEQYSKLQRELQYEQKIHALTEQLHDCRNESAAREKQYLNSISQLKAEISQLKAVNSALQPRQLEEVRHRIEQVEQEKIVLQKKLALQQQQRENAQELLLQQHILREQLAALKKEFLKRCKDVKLKDLDRLLQSVASGAKQQQPQQQGSPVSGEQSILLQSNQSQQHASPNKLVSQRNFQDIKRIRELEQLVEELQNNLKKRFPDSISQLIYASKIQDETLAAQNDQLKVENDRLAGQLEHLQAEFQQKLDVIKGEYLLLQERYASLNQVFTDLQRKHQLQQQTEKSKDENSVDEDNRTAEEKVKELQREIEKVRIFYNKKLEEQQRKHELTIKHYKRNQHGQEGQVQGQLEREEYLEELSRQNQALRNKLQVYEQRLEFLEDELLATSEELGQIKQQHQLQQQLQQHQQPQQKFQVEFKENPGSEEQKIGALASEEQLQHLIEERVRRLIPEKSALLQESAESGHELAEAKRRLVELQSEVQRQASTIREQRAVISEKEQQVQSLLLTLQSGVGQPLQPPAPPMPQLPPATASEASSSSYGEKVINVLLAERDALHSKLLSIQEERSLLVKEVEHYKDLAKQPKSPALIQLQLLEKQVESLEGNLQRRERELLRALEQSKLSNRLERDRLVALHEQQLREKDEQLLLFQRELGFIMEEVKALQLAPAKKNAVEVHAEGERKSEAEVEVGQQDSLHAGKEVQSVDDRELREIIANSSNNNSSNSKTQTPVRRGSVRGKSDTSNTPSVRRRGSVQSPNIAFTPHVTNNISTPTR